MARIRSVHPGLFTDEAFVTLSPLARLLAIGVWTECDDHGVFEWKPVTLKMRLFPIDAVDIPELLGELEAVGLVCRFTEGPRSFGAVRNFCKFQRPKKPRYSNPLPDHFRIFVAWKDKHSEQDEGQDGQEGQDAGPDDNQTPRVPPEPPTASPPVPHEGGNVSAVGEEGREGKGRKEGSELRSGASPPVAEAVDAKIELWRAGLATLRTLTGQASGPARKLLGKLIDAAGGDHARLLALIRRAEVEQPDGPAAWLVAGAQALSAPVLALVASPAAATVHDRLAALPGAIVPDAARLARYPTDVGHILLGGWHADVIWASLADAAGFDPWAWPGELAPLGTWLAALTLHQDANEVIVGTIRRVASRPSYVPPRSLAYFSDAVREATDAGATRSPRAWTVAGGGEA